MKHRRCTSVGQQKKIAIEMWQYIKSQIKQDVPIYTITLAKQKWLHSNYPDVEWKNYCLLCNLYLHQVVIENGCRKFDCSECPLTKKYAGRVSYGCSFDDAITPWSKVVDFEYKKEEAIKACDEIIETIESLQGEEFS